MATTIGEAIRLNPSAESQEVTNLGAPTAPTSAARKQDITNAAIDTTVFKLNGIPIVGTQVDGAWIAPWACTLIRITLYRKTAGAAGSTTVDVNKNGTTVFTTQANRPSVAFGAGNDAVSAHTDMDVTAVALNDRITMDIDAIETGNPRDVDVIVEVQKTL